MTPTPKTPKSPKSPNATASGEGSKRLFSVYNKREFLSAIMLTNCNPNKELIVMARFRATGEKRECVKGELKFNAFILQRFFIFDIILFCVNRIYQRTSEGMSETS